LKKPEKYSGSISIIYIDRKERTSLQYMYFKCRLYSGIKFYYT